MTPENAPVEYVDDLTHQDAREIMAFIGARTTDGSPTATALHVAVLHLHLGVTDEIPRLGNPFTTEYRSIPARIRMRTAWNGLVAAAGPWADHPDYAAARWRHIDNCDQRPTD
ncbi:hypothetical protein [Kitasatospora sp. NPDC088134]|uniref:hypothetical protein n=1 Tax=Kitasatospora sp. NPDC088134 TaxID=3364071 RepID=UPI0038193711